MAKDIFLGTGMKFPPQINPNTGRFVNVSGEESVKESIYLILMTQKTERIMRPSYGSKAMGYVFTQTDATSLNLISHEIQNDILKNEPRVEQVAVKIDTTSKQGCMFVYIDYIVRGRNVRENMVFPFYLGGEPEEKGEVYETVEDDFIE